MSVPLLIMLLLVSPRDNVQLNAPIRNFSVTLERIGCLGSCPDYKVTIFADGTVQYEGRAYVRVKGSHTKTIQRRAVRNLIEKLQAEDFFDWKEKQTTCLDLPEILITANLNGRHKRVTEGCNEPGQVLTLADELDRISGALKWVH